MGFRAEVKVLGALEGALPCLFRPHQAARMLAGDTILPDTPPPRLTLTSPLLFLKKDPGDLTRPSQVIQDDLLSQSPSFNAICRFPLLWEEHIHRF